MHSWTTITSPLREDVTLSCTWNVSWADGLLLKQFREDVPSPHILYSSSLNAWWYLGHRMNGAWIFEPIPEEEPQKRFIQPEDHWI